MRGEVELETAVAEHLVILDAADDASRPGDPGLELGARERRHDQLVNAQDLLAERQPVGIDADHDRHGAQLLVVPQPRVDRGVPITIDDHREVGPALEAAVAGRPQWAVDPIRLGLKPSSASIRLAVSAPSARRL